MFFFRNFCNCCGWNTISDQNKVRVVPVQKEETRGILYLLYSFIRVTTAEYQEESYKKLLDNIYISDNVIEENVLLLSEKPTPLSQSMKKILI